MNTFSALKSTRMYQEYNSNDLWNKEAAGNSVDSRFQRFLLRNFSAGTAKMLYCIVIETIALFAKIGVYLILPFKAIQFFCQSWQKISENEKATSRDK